MCCLFTLPQLVLKIIWMRWEAYNKSTRRSSFFLKQHTVLIKIKEHLFSNANHLYYQECRFITRFVQNRPSVAAWNRMSIQTTRATNTAWSHISTSRTATPLYWLQRWSSPMMAQKCAIETIGIPWLFWKKVKQKQMNY